MGARIRAFDWSRSPLGDVATWPTSLRTLVELMLATPQPVCIAWGPDLRVLFNDAYVPMLGPREPSALGTPLLELWPEVASELRPIFDATLRGEPQHFADRPIPTEDDGDVSVRYFTFSWSPVRDDGGAIAGIYATVTETTEKVVALETLRRKAEEDVRQTRMRQRELFDAFDDGFCIIEVLFDDAGAAQDYRFIEANSSFERHSGLRDAVGKRMRELAPEHESWWFQTYGRVALTGEPARFENYAAGLSGRWFDVLAFRVGDPSAREVAVLFTDITARRRAEEAIREADRRKDEFLATLAHELRNPLAPLRTGIDVARVTTPRDAPLARTLDVMDRQLAHLVRLVDDLLDVGRISSGKLELRRRRITLGEILASSLESTRAVVEQRGHRIVSEVGPEDVTLFGDFDRLSQVFTNLLSNAAKYTANGGTIRIAATPEGDRVAVRVSDDGVGIPPAELDHVFELFSQVRAHQALTSGGLGIGLALVKRLVALHGGTVEAFSEGADRGSVFTVRLPVASPVSSADDEGTGEEATGADPPARRRIVVADDNADGAQLLSELFELLGHDVWIAGDGEEALETVRRVEPDLIVLDLGMPRLDGIETARRLRATALGRSATIVALTGWGQDEDRRRTREAGFDHHLVKPVDPDALRSLLALRPRG